MTGVYALQPCSARLYGCSESPGPVTGVWNYSGSEGLIYMTQGCQGLGKDAGASRYTFPRGSMRTRNQRNLSDSLCWKVKF